MVDRAAMMDAPAGLGEDHCQFNFDFEADRFGDLGSMTRALSEFCTGADTAESSPPVLMRVGGSATGWPGPVNMQEVTRWEREVRRLERLPRVLIAVVDGQCAGPALDILLACDLRVASPDSAFRLAVNHEITWPGTAIYRLVHQIGSGHARRIALLGAGIDAQQAAGIGLVDELDPEPWRRGQELLRGLRGFVGKEVAVRRALVLEAPYSPYEDALGAHLAACSRELKRVEAAKQP